MNVEQWSKKLLVFLGGCLFVITSPVFAQGTAAEREACTPDVFRLCSSLIPDAIQIATCLRRQKSNLSDACKNVIFPAVRLGNTDAGAKPKSASP